MDATGVKDLIQANATTPLPDLSFELWPAGALRGLIAAAAAEVVVVVAIVAVAPIKITPQDTIKVSLMGFWDYYFYR